MRFTIEDTMTLGRVVASGACNDEYSPTFAKREEIIDNYERRFGPITDIREIPRKMPRLNVITPERSPEVAKGDIVKLAPEKQQVFGWAYSIRNRHGRAGRGSLTRHVRRSGHRTSCPAP